MVPRDLKDVNIAGVPVVPRDQRDINIPAVPGVNCLPRNHSHVGISLWSLGSLKSLPHPWSPLGSQVYNITGVLGVSLVNFLPKDHSHEGISLGSPGTIGTLTSLISL